MAFKGASVRIPPVLRADVRVSVRLLASVGQLVVVASLRFPLSLCVVPQCEQTKSSLPCAPSRIHPHSSHSQLCCVPDR